jgi:hypothetical protein
MAAEANGQNLADRPCSLMPFAHAECDGAWNAQKMVMVTARSFVMGAPVSQEARLDTLWLRWSQGTLDLAVRASQD